jgi:gliding motility-associated lipoprotein GldD
MKIKILFLGMIGMVLSACSDIATPKPSGYFRIELPERVYHPIDVPCPFTFKVSSAAELEVKDSTQCFYNINYEGLSAKFHLSYKPIQNNLNQLIEQEFEMREKHNAFSTGVRESVFQSYDENLTALVFHILGTKAATPLQFYATDSTNHFLRGTLYFYNSPNNDSLQPVIQYLRRDLDTLVNSIRWK